MILELDVGNSFIKWRCLNAGGGVSGGGIAESLADLLAEKNWLGLVSGCRVVSVRSDQENQEIRHALLEALQASVVLAQSADSLAGVCNGYEEPSKLGLDRWLALVAAYNLSRRACLVLDLGTAVTVDFVGADGLHLGGFICPGLPLMRAQLKTHTRRIRYEQGEAEGDLRLPGRSTAEAVERGCYHMIRGFALGQLELAVEALGADFEVLITGGDAACVADLFPGARVVPDLVFRGLALACPLAGGR